jgi:ankyrin repeat protein
MGARATELVELIIKVSEGKGAALGEELQRHLAKLPDPNKALHVQGYNPLTPLQWVASRGLVEEARLLILRGANVNLTRPPLASPIAFAFEEGHGKVAELLLQHGADRADALRRAVKSNKPSLIKMVCKQGGDIPERDECGRTAIHWAGYYGAAKAARLLVEMGADVNDRDDKRDTPLHYAAAFDEPRAAKALIELGAKVNAKNRENKTPLDEVGEELSPALARFLRAARG